MNYNFGWIVTKNYLDNKEVEIIGPSVTSLIANDFINSKNSVKFRLLDDDKELYFEGYVIEDPANGESILAPLDDFGFAFGCTILQTLENGKWKAVN